MPGSTVTPGRFVQIETETRSGEDDPRRVGGCVRGRDGECALEGRASLAEAGVAGLVAAIPVGVVALLGMLPVGPFILPLPVLLFVVALPMDTLAG